MAHTRSPAYPSLSLPAAIEMIRKVHAKQQRTAEPRDVVMRHMGYSSENGRALKAISALIKYGFLVKEGKDSWKVSDRAITIMFPNDDDDRIQALHEAANSPALFVEIFERWEQRPTFDSLKSFLIRKGFNVNSVEHVARSFYETFDLVSGGTDSYASTSSHEDVHAQKEADAMPETTPTNPEPKKGGLNFIKAMKDVQHANLRNVTKPVFDFETVQVHTAIDNQSDLDELIERLQKIRSMLPPKGEH